MQAIIPDRPAHVRPYAWGSISVNPDPPRVGELTRIVFPLTNPGQDELVVKRIDVQIARFGMGVTWEKLGSIGPFRLPPDPNHIEEAFVEWTPTQGGHRCVRANIHVKGVRSPLLAARNLHVIDAAAGDGDWLVPFLLGNPQRVRAPIMLRVGAEGDGNLLRAALRVAGRAVPTDQPIWLRPGEEVDAELRLFAPPGQALDGARTVEAYIAGRLIDGIQVTVHRPALVQPIVPRPAAPEAVPAGRVATLALV